jgi:hypothetical protein
MVSIIKSSIIERNERERFDGIDETVEYRLTNARRAWARTWTECSPRSSLRTERLNSFLEMTDHPIWSPFHRKVVYTE